MECNLASFGLKVGMNTKVQLTPALAQFLLTLNDKNVKQRPRSKKKIGKMISDIKAGKFTYNPIPLIISKEYSLTNGQHRCFSVIEAGIPIIVNISLAETDDSDFTKFDRNGRTSRDIFYMAGFIHQSLANAIEHINTISGKIYNVSDEDSKIEFAKQNLKQLDMAYDLGKRAKKGTNVALTIATAIAFVAIKSGYTDEACEFFEQVATGNDIHDGDPSKYCRDKWVDYRGKTGHHIDEAMSIGWKSFRAFVHKQKIGKNGIKVNGVEDKYPSLS